MLSEREGERGEKKESRKGEAYRRLLSIIQSTVSMFVVVLFPFVDSSVG
jgi:hypothetical protein